MPPGVNPIAVNKYIKNHRFTVVTELSVTDGMTKKALCTSIAIITTVTPVGKVSKHILALNIKLENFSNNLYI